MTDTRTSKYSEEQIIGFLRQAEAGIPIEELCRKHGFSDASFYKWRARVEHVRNLFKYCVEMENQLGQGGVSRQVVKNQSSGLDSRSREGQSRLKSMPPESLRIISTWTYHVFPTK